MFKKKSVDDRMFAMNKEMMMMVAIAVALFATFYLYKDQQKTKTEFDSLKTILNTPPPTKKEAPPVASAESEE